MADPISKRLVKEAEAKEFWEITLDNVAKIIPMPRRRQVAKRHQSSLG
jgi:hypothetical protein